VLSLNTADPSIEFFCDYEGTIRAGSVIDVDWFIQGEKSSSGDNNNVLVYTDEMIERRRSVLTEGHWMGKMGSQVYCEMRARWEDKTGAPSPVIKSEKYFAGIKVLKRLVSVSEAEDETQIQLQSTVPINCLPQFKDSCKITVELAHDSEWKGKQCIDGKMNQVVFGDCKIDITPSNWRQVHNVSVKAVRDFYNDGNKKMLVNFKPVYSTYASMAWNDYKIPEVEVLAKDSPTSMCSSTGDPHYTTFDGHYYHVYLEGEFVMYKNTRLPYQINVRLENCGKVVSCNCAVAVKAGDDVIVIDRCGRRKVNLAHGASFPEGWRTVHKHVLEQGGSLTHGLKIYEYDEGRKYTVHLPSGAYLDFHVADSWINIYLHGSSDDFKSTLGLCGTFDGDKSNDFMFPDSMTMTTPREDEACGESPDVCQFSQAWRVSELESFFGPVVDIPMDEPVPTSPVPYCKCEEREDGKTDVVCNYLYDVQNCEEVDEMMEGEDKTDEFKVKTHSRSRRSTVFTDRVDDDDYFNTEFVYDKNYVGKEPKWPTPSGITESYARNRCYAAIMFSDVGRICHRVLYNRLTQLLESCVIDIKVTDDFRWIKSSVDLMTSECVSHIHGNAAYWPDEYVGHGTTASETGQATTKSTDSTTTKTATRPVVKSMGESLLATICPLGCSQNGRCVDHHCQCYKGYTGADCSIPVSLPPKLKYVSENGLCDVRRRPCAYTAVYGSHFRRAAKLECLFKEMSEESEVTHEYAEFRTFEELECSLPLFSALDEYYGDTDSAVSQGEDSTHKVFSLSILQDEVETEEKKIVLLYDSKCKECSVDNDNYTCTDKMDSCQIGGHCFQSAEEDPGDCCKVCRPSVNRHTFINQTEPPLPVIYPVQDTYTITTDEDWRMTVSATGCNVNYSVINRMTNDLENKVRKGLELAVGSGGVYVHSMGTTEGLVTFEVKATESCGGLTVSKNYTVHITRGSSVTTNSMCTDNEGPSFTESALNLTAVFGELLKISLPASHKHSEQKLTYFVLKSTSNYVSISDVGVLRYMAPSAPAHETLTIIAEDECGQRAYKDLIITTTPCPCPPSERCLPRASAPRGSGLYDCQCDIIKAGSECPTVGG